MLAGIDRVAIGGAVFAAEYPAGDMGGTITKKLANGYTFDGGESHGDQRDIGEDGEMT